MGCRLKPRLNYATLVWPNSSGLDTSAFSEDESCSRGKQDGIVLELRVVPLVGSFG
jgi:hypothetical protein